MLCLRYQEGGWDWLPAMFGPQAECVGGEEKQRISGADLASRSQALWAGRARWDLMFPRPIQTCSYLPVGSGHTRPGGTGRADSPAAQTGAGELGLILHHNLAQTMQERVPG